MIRSLMVIALFAAGVGSAAASTRASAPSFAQLAASMTGHWTCSSRMGTKVTSYTADWALVPNTKWIRGTNRTASSTSEDMETYDAASKQWRIVDMEPNGSMSVLVGTAAQMGHVATRSVYPDASQYVRYDRVSSHAYTLTFDFLIAGKHARWVDICNADKRAKRRLPHAPGKSAMRMAPSTTMVPPLRLAAVAGREERYVAKRLGIEVFSVVSGARKV